MCCEGKITNLEASQKIGIAPRNVTKLKRKYEVMGMAAFVRASKGHKPYNKKYSEELINNILKLYYQFYQNTPYKTFWRGLRDIEHINIHYESLRLILKKHNIKPYKIYTKKEKPKHHSRKEREHFGELVQMDASKHDWFMNGTYTNLHGAIDDATHTITGLYFCDNECRLGYNEVLRQTFENYGIMDAVYIDRHSSFVTNFKTDITLSERVEHAKQSETHFVELCNILHIEIILALSAEAKGRIERLWGTLQGILPFLFRRLGIQDNQHANSFLQTYLPILNKDFSITPVSPVSYFKKRQLNLSYLLAIKIRKRTDQYGIFNFHNQYFELLAPRKCHVYFTLCISEQFGIKAFYQGKYYDVALTDDFIAAVRGDRLTHVEEDLINRFLLSDVHSDVV